MSWGNSKGMRGLGKSERRLLRDRYYRYVEIKSKVIKGLYFRREGIGWGSGVGIIDVGL